MSHRLYKACGTWATSAQVNKMHVLRGSGSKRSHPGHPALPHAGQVVSTGGCCNQPLHLLRHLCPFSAACIATCGCIARCSSCTLALQFGSEAPQH